MRRLSSPTSFLLFIYLALLFGSIIYMRTEEFTTGIAKLVLCYDAATVFGSTIDAYNAGRMFKYVPIVHDAGTCFYYTNPNEACIPGITGFLTLSSQRYNHGLAAINSKACIYAPSSSSTP